MSDKSVALPAELVHWLKQRLQDRLDQLQEDAAALTTEQHAVRVELLNQLIEIHTAEKIALERQIEAVAKAI